MPFDVGQAALDAVVLKRQLLVVEAEQVQDRRVQIVERMNILNGFQAELIGRSMADARL